MQTAAQHAVHVGAGSYASYAPLTESRSAEHDGCQAYQTEHRRLYLPDSLLSRLSLADGTKEGSIALPTNDWWTYALVNQWTGKLWFYPGWTEATEAGIEIGYPDHWEPTGCEVKWDTPLSVAFRHTATGRPAVFSEALIDSWSDFSVSFIMQDGDAWVRTTCVQGSPLVWLEAEGIELAVVNPDLDRYAVWTRAVNGKNWLVVALLTDGLDASSVESYVWHVPRKTVADYSVKQDISCLDTYFRIFTEDIFTGAISLKPCILGFLPHHYHSLEYSKNNNVTDSDVKFLTGGSGYVSYLTPRGEMRIAAGNDFCFRYTTHGILPFFPAPFEWAEGFSKTIMQSLNADYVQRGSFGADTYWGGKGLIQMMHYMTFAMQMGDTVNYRVAHSRLRAILEDWYTYTPGESDRYFARFPRFGALVGFDPSYDSETFNDHHFHYGYFVYASAVMCMLDSDFRDKYDQMAREVALDYACWLRNDSRYPYMRTFNPYCGHSFAGGMGNEGNGNGQESSSEALQSWGAVMMLGAALGDTEMLNAGIYGYTVEAHAVSEYWFDRARRNIDYTKYTHPYCCNLTMQGVGWWTWFSGDPVWMHSIQWLPISPILSNCFSEDLAFTRWDYTQMYAAKEVGDYEAETNGLGDESGLGNVCLSYLSLFNADSAARVWDRMYLQNKPLARNTDTGGITYWLTHIHRSLGEKRYDIFSDYPLACAYTDTVSGVTTYAVYNVNMRSQRVHFFGAKDTVVVAHVVGMNLFAEGSGKTVAFPVIPDDKQTAVTDSMAWDLPYANLALHKSVTVSSSENAGTLPVSLTDGDYTTRWGSTHQDGEFAVVDLGEKCYVNHLVLHWETAYASRYEIALSDDNHTWHTAVLTSSGGVETVYLSELNNQLSTSRGRYLRITGLERATIYGTSLYELEAYGRPMNGVAGKLFALAVMADDNVLKQGQSTIITVTGYDALGGIVACQPVLSVVEGEASLSGNVLTCSKYGAVFVKAECGGVSAVYQLVVMEAERPVAVVVAPLEPTVPVGEIETFVISCVNQFGVVLDTCQYIYHAAQAGDTTLTFLCNDMQATTIVHRLPYTEVNLALGKHAIASGYENDGTKPAAAVDGKTDTRWSSRFQDGEWIEVNLGSCYNLTSVRLLWESAYATAYEVLLSQDAVNYTIVYSTTMSNGGTEVVPVMQGGQPVSAQYVRLVCKARNTGYGASLWELEVYGTGRCGNGQTGIDVVSTTKERPYKFHRNGNLYLCHPVYGIFDATGRHLNE